MTPKPIFSRLQGQASPLVLSVERNGLDGEKHFLLLGRVIFHTDVPQARTIFMVKGN